MMINNRTLPLLTFAPSLDNYAHAFAHAHRSCAQLAAVGAVRIMTIVG